jgi:hypothetical protein
MKKEIIQYSFSLNHKVRLYDKELKGAMKEAFREILPVKIVERDKKGFSIPLHSWKNLVDSGITRQEKILCDFGVIKC